MDINLPKVFEVAKTSDVYNQKNYSEDMKHLKHNKKRKKSTKPTSKNNNHFANSDENESDDKIHLDDYA